MKLMFTDIIATSKEDRALKGKLIINYIANIIKESKNIEISLARRQAEDILSHCGEILNKETFPEISDEDKKIIAQTMEEYGAEISIEA